MICPKCSAYMLEHPENLEYKKCPTCGFSLHKDEIEDPDPKVCLNDNPRTKTGNK